MEFGKRAGREFLARFTSENMIYFAFTNSVGFHVPSPGGRMEGGSVFGQ